MLRVVSASWLGCGTRVLGDRAFRSQSAGGRGEMGVANGDVCIPCLVVFDFDGSVDGKRMSNAG